MGTFVHKKEVFASHSLFSALKCWCIDSAVEAFESMLVKNMDNLDKCWCIDSAVEAFKSLGTLNGFICFPTFSCSFDST